MPDRRRKRCYACNRHSDVCGPISWRGKCRECAHRIVHENVEGLHFHSGEPFQAWRRGMAASVGAMLIEDAE